MPNSSQLPANQVLNVAKDQNHEFSKKLVSAIDLVKGFGVKGDAHFGASVKHRSRVAKDPNQPNLRQVHLIAHELLQEMAEHGFSLHPGQLGENILTSGIDLIKLPLDTRLVIGKRARLRVTGLRNPCVQIENFRPGLLSHMIEKNADGTTQLKTGIMGIVEMGGAVHAGDTIKIIYPRAPFIQLQRV